MEEPTEIIDLGEMLTEEGKLAVKVGMVLVFDKDGVKTTIKVTKLDQDGFFGEIVPNLLTEDEAGRTVSIVSNPEGEEQNGL